MLPVGLLGEHRKTSFTFGVQHCSTACGSSAKPALACSGTLTTLRALDARRHGVHAEGRAGR